MNNPGRITLIVVLVFLSLPFLWGGMMTGGMGPGMMWGWQGTDRWDWSRGVWMMLPGVLILGGAIAALVWGLGNANIASPGNPSAPTARDILDARYARGEITREQYQEMKRELSA